MSETVVAVRPSVTAVQQRTSRHWIVAGGATCCMVAGSVPLSGLSFFHPYVIKELFPTNQSAFLLYYTWTMLAIVASMMFVGGPLLAKVGPKALMIAGAVVVAGALCVFAVSSTAPMFYLAGVILGAGYGISFQLVPVIWVSNWFVARKGTVLGLVFGGTGIGGMLWSFAIPAIAAGPGWRTGYYVMAAVVLVMAIPPTLFLVVNKPSDVGLMAYGADPAKTVASLRDTPQAPPGFTYRQALRTPWLWLLYAMTALLGVVHAAAQILAVYLQGAAYADPRLPMSQQPPSQTAFFSLLMMTWTLSLLLLKPVLGYLNDKIGITWAMALALAAQSLTFLYLPQMSYGSTVSLMFLAMVLMAAGMSTGTVEPPLLAARAFGSREFGRIWSTAGTAYLVGMALGAPTWGLIKDTLGSYLPGFYAAPLALAVIVTGASFAATRSHAAHLDLYRREQARQAAPVAGPVSGR